MSGPLLAVVGTPGDRRVTMFADACVRYGLRPPQVVPWTSVLGGEEIALEPATLVRIDSPGEDAETDALLRGPGEPSRVGGGARWYAAFTAGMQRVREAVERTPGAVLLGDVDEIAVMFDKRLCHARLTAAEVPVPPALTGPGEAATEGPIEGYASLRERMDRAGWGRVFVKPAHGSSASGVIALHAAGSRVTAVTSVELSSGGLHNSLRVRRYEREADLAVIVDRLAGDGLHVERWFPKAGLGGRTLDLRVVAVDGTPTHAVVRASRTPMTNLHLGGARGDLGAVRARLGERGWARVLDVCSRAAACFPRSPSVGVDLMIGVDWRSVAVAEVNAFGDLLPGLTGFPGGGAEGLDTYDAQVRAVMRISCGT
ncbi:STM4014 family protein [Planomonospora sp. ID67723]|uniref:STM4014 family protein n=1 Tax=Planomonospora sp. ID67723 TaxID=2738134 RepID=UPI0018C4341C|nr:STM4014 family protein [Planomonospora sp. ID67723]MBG0829857.1 STM4014 family protein [Planomonospora sp. ID67723]